MNNYLRKAEKLAKKGDFNQAGSLYEIAGELENAAKMYSRGGGFMQAARIYENLKYNQKAADLFARGGNFLKAAELFKISENYLKAAQMFQKADKNFNAAEMYRQAKKFLPAATNYEKASQFEAAGDMYIKANRVLQASQSYLKGYSLLDAKKDDEILLRDKEVGLHRIAIKAAEAFLNANELKKSAHFFELANLPHKAAELYLKTGEIAQAIEMFFQGRLFKKGLELIEKHKKLPLNLFHFANILNNEGFILESALLFEQAGHFEDAGYQYQQIGDSIKAAQNFEKAEVFLLAGHSYLEVEEFGKAGDMFVKANNHRFAAEAYFKAGLLREAIEQYEALKDFLTASKLAKEIKDNDLYISLLEKVEENSPEFLEASYRLGTIYFEKEQFNDAMERFQELTNENQLNPHQTDTLYFIGRIWEKWEELDNADEAYKQIIKMDRNFKDAQMRLKEIKKKQSIRKQNFSTAKIKLKKDRYLETQNEYEQLTFMRRRYSIEATIGQGALGKVFRARDTLLNRVVTLKEINKNVFKTPVTVARLKMKIMVAARLNHPNIVTIYDMGEDENTFLIAREYVDGVNLKQFLRSGGLPLHKARSILTSCLLTLDYAHKQKVFHRNLCPENILISKDNIVKISDFGMYFKSTELIPVHAKQQNRKNVYLSYNNKAWKPEKIIDDIQSAAQILIFMLNGKVKNTPEMQKKDPEWLGNYKFPERIQDFLARCFTSDKKQLVKSANEFASVLKTNLLEPGVLFDNRYEIISELGRGGMGSVFKAHDRVMKELVALKTLRSSALLDERNLKRFKWEIKAARKISHPNVIKIYFLGFCEGTYYISMELIYGITLKELINNGKQIPLIKKIDILIQITDAIAAVHALDIIHRDIKPQNILLDKNFQVKLVDFGIARMGDTQGVTETGEVMGTPEYMAPEQIKKKNDHRSDIYSFGIVMYEFITGELPFTGETPISILMAHLKKEPSPPSLILKTIDKTLENIILKCIKKSPASRFQSMVELSQTLKDYLLDFSKISKDN